MTFILILHNAYFSENGCVASDFTFMRWNIMENISRGKEKCYKVHGRWDQNFAA